MKSNICMVQGVNRTHPFYPVNMNKEQKKQEISKIREHIRILNITGGVAISALAVAGYLLLTSPAEENTRLTKNMEAITNEAESNMEVQASVTSPAIDEISADVAVAAKQEQAQTKAVSAVVKQNRTSGLKTNALAAAEKTGLTKSIAEELQSFEASCDNGSILFNWVTEGVSKYAYEIEKTYDKVHYEVFSRAPQPEKKEGKNFYSVEEATEKDENAYYRLRKVIGKGRYEYSDPVQVKCESSISANTDVDVFPNGYGSFRIIINTGSESQFKVSLSDVDENELVADSFDAKPGSNEFIISSNSISRGNYVLRVTNGSMIKEKRVVLK